MDEQVLRYLVDALLVAAPAIAAMCAVSAIAGALVEGTGRRLAAVAAFLFFGVVVFGYTVDCPGPVARDPSYFLAGPVAIVDLLWWLANGLLAETLEPVLKPGSLIAAAACSAAVCVLAAGFARRASTQGRRIWLVHAVLWAALALALATLPVLARHEGIGPPNWWFWSFVALAVMVPVASFLAVVAIVGRGRVGTAVLAGLLGVAVLTTGAVAAGDPGLGGILCEIYCAAARRHPARGGLERSMCGEPGDCFAERGYLDEGARADLGTCPRLARPRIERPAQEVAPTVVEVPTHAAYLPTLAKSAVVSSPSRARGDRPPAGP